MVPESSCAPVGAEKVITRLLTLVTKITKAVIAQMTGLP